MLDAPGMCLHGRAAEASLGVCRVASGARMGAHEVAAGGAPGSREVMQGSRVVQVGRGGYAEASRGGCGGHGSDAHGRAAQSARCGGARAALHSAATIHGRLGL